MLDVVEGMFEKLTASAILRGYSVEGSMDTVSGSGSFLAELTQRVLRLWRERPGGQLGGACPACPEGTRGDAHRVTRAPLRLGGQPAQVVDHLLEGIAADDTAARPRSVGKRTKQHPVVLLAIRLRSPALLAD